VIEPATTFKDVKTGVQACERLHRLICDSRNRHEKANMKKENSEMKKSAKKATANARTKVTGKGKKASKKVATKKAATKANGAAPHMKFDEKAKIAWIAEGNPFREGSGRAERVNMLIAAKDKTVGHYLENRGRKGTLAYCVKNKMAKVG